MLEKMIEIGVNYTLGALVGEPLAVPALGKVLKDRPHIHFRFDQGVFVSVENQSGTTDILYVSKRVIINKEIRKSFPVYSFENASGRKRPV